MNQLIVIFSGGLVILAVAIVLNAIAIALGLPTWYTFFGFLSEHGFSSAVRMVRVIGWLFLLVVYPLILGFIAYSWFDFFA